MQIGVMHGVFVVRHCLSGLIKSINNLVKAHKYEVLDSEFIQGPS
jgi:hypothetical protein